MIRSHFKRIEHRHNVAYKLLTVKLRIASPMVAALGFGLSLA
jgi:mannose/fructose/N-acetylgalactosamine-specific phosphotransferase system component IIC